MINIKLDYTLTEPEDRLKLVQDILDTTPEPTPAYLETLADYLVLCAEKKDRKLMTQNRKSTIRERETSFEGLQSQFENGEDIVYSLVREDKNILFKPKQQITKQDLEDIPALAQLRQGIDLWEKALKSATGRDAFIIKKGLIEMRKEQYLIKQAYKPQVGSKPFSLNGTKRIELRSRHFLSIDNKLYYTGFSFCDPKIVRLVLNNYSRLKQAGYANFTDDFWFFMEDFDNISSKALAEYPLYERLVTYKIDGKSAPLIKELIEKEFPTQNHGIGYYSTLWSKKIPFIIAHKAQEEYLKWFYEQNPEAEFKVCSKCGQRLPANLFFFSRNKKSYYSRCKKCRRKGSENNGE